MTDANKQNAITEALQRLYPRARGEGLTPRAGGLTRDLKPVRESMAVPKTSILLVAAVRAHMEAGRWRTLVVAGILGGVVAAYTVSCS